MNASVDTVTPNEPDEPRVVDAGRLGSFERMNAFGPRGEASAWWCMLIALALHTWGAASATFSTFDIDQFGRLIQSQVTDRLNASVDIEQEPPPPEPEPEPEPEEPPPEVKQVELPTPIEPDLTTPPAEEPPAPAPAEAAQVLTSTPDPDAPLDLTGEGFISGTGTRFAGGVTAGSGTSKTAVRSAGARPDGIPGGKGSGPAAPPPVDKSRPAQLPPNFNWNACGFPPEADAEQINQAAVRLVVTVGSDGSPTAVNVLSDPGFGFARWVQRCAMRPKYPTGLDKSGKPIASTTKPFTVRFTR